MKQAVPNKSNRSVFALKLNHRLREGMFIIAAALAVFLFISFASYHSSDPGWSSTGMDSPILNWGGRAGAFIADIFLTFFGYMSYTFPILIVAAGWLAVRFGKEDDVFDWVEISFRFLGFVLIILSGSGLITLYLKAGINLPAMAGGILGDLISSGLTQYFNSTGSALFLTTAFLCGITLFCGISWIGLIDTVGGQVIRSFRLIEWKKIKNINFKNFLSHFKFSILKFRKSQKSIEPKIEPKQKLEIKPNKFFQIPTAEPKLLEPTKLFEPNKEYLSGGIAQTTQGSPLLQAQTTGISHTADASGANANSNYNTTKLTHINPSNIQDDEDEFLDARQNVSKNKLSWMGPANNPIHTQNNPYDTKHNQDMKNDLPKVSENRGDSNKEPDVKNREMYAKQTVYEPAIRYSANEIPPLTLLNPPKLGSGKAFSNLSFEDLSCLVEQRLLDFGVTVKVVAVHPGPVITRLELELAPGIKVSKITGLAKDIARSLSVTSVRVVEVIPGKSVIGLEIPNEHREVVVLRDLLESQRYIQAKSPVSLALGKDIAGHPVVVDLAKMPHLLAAGTTGSGKSVSINAMLLSMLYKATPDQLRLILIDPKMLELSVYEGIPHLLTPVITDMKDAANALRWCVAEMDRRYKLMSSQGVRNLTGYNQKIQDAIDNNNPIPAPEWLLALGKQPPHLTPLPMVVVVADEFADMMMVVGRKIEDLVTRIAQKARAAGIHLILATQRPSVDVITGLIKANIPTRIAFQVSSRIDSRTILDQQGAEQLLGHGDMLYLPPGTGLPVRVHGAYVADDEVHRVVAAWQAFGRPEYLDEVTEDLTENAQQTADSGELDPLYDEALKIVTETRRASISLVQRKLKIGYNRAATIMESMEAAGVVSAMDSSGSREVLAPPPVDA